MKKSFTMVHGIAWAKLIDSPNEDNDDQPDINYQYMGGSKNRGTPKWMVYNGKPY